MKTPSLFPPRAIPKNKRHPHTITELIKKHDIWMDGHGDRGPTKWEGFSIPRAREFLDGYLDGTEDGYDIFSGYCRLLDESGVMISASTRPALVRAIAAQCEEEEVK